MKTLSPQKKIQESWGERIHYTGKRDAFIIICRSKVSVCSTNRNSWFCDSGKRVNQSVPRFQAGPENHETDEGEMGSGGRSSQHAAKDVGIIKVHK